jgi:3-methylfumaryl-CoA hydratase
MVERPQADGTIDVGHLRTWIGRTERRRAAIDPWTVEALAATLGVPARMGGGAGGGTAMPGDPLPPGWHWCFFLEAAPREALGRDGHPALGGFMPPVPLSRRMWAGGRLSFEDGLRIGDEAEKVSEVAEVTVREGRSGTLVFVTVRHTVTVAGRSASALVEEHDIVYRPERASAGGRRGETAPSAGRRTEPPPEEADWRREVTPDPVLLFRYSALTFNGHRIHYDRSYAADVEGYPGLVVHGPLVATLLLDLLRSGTEGAAVRRFSFRALAPLFDTAPFSLAGRRRGGEAELWALGPGGTVAMTARAELS